MSERITNAKIYELIDRLRVEVKGDINGLRTETQGRIDGLHEKLDEGMEAIKKEVRDEKAARSNLSGRVYTLITFGSLVTGGFIEMLMRKLLG